MALRVLIAGAAGRMGKELLLHGLNLQSKGTINLVGGSVSSNHPARGEDIRKLLNIPEDTGIICHDDLKALLYEADAVLDFTKPNYSLEIAELCALMNKMHICGTTGFSQQQLAQLSEYANKTRILQSYNMSLTMNLIAHLVQECASKLGPEFDIEILEMHHKHKFDAPSGTAIMLGKAAAAGRNVDLMEQAVWERHGYIGPRKSGDIGFATLRGGSVIGEHSVIFAGEHEHMTINHRSFDRKLYVPGTYYAAQWLAKQPAGRLYTMADALGYSVSTPQ